MELNTNHITDQINQSLLSRLSQYGKDTKKIICNIIRPVMLLTPLDNKFSLVVQVY